MMLALLPLQILNADCGYIGQGICAAASYVRTRVDCADLSAESFNRVTSTCYKDDFIPGGNFDVIVPNGSRNCVRLRETGTYYCDSNNQLQGPILDSWTITNSCPKLKTDGSCQIAHQSTNPKPFKIAAVVAATISN